MNEINELAKQGADKRPVEKDAVIAHFRNRKSPEIVENERPRRGGQTVSGNPTGNRSSSGQQG